MPPARPTKRIISQDDIDQNGFQLRFCDVIIMVALLLVVGTTTRGIYQQVSVQEARLSQESILCIKDFDSKGCNPFNMTSACQEKMDCIKNGDGLGFSGVMEIVNKHIKNNGAVPAIMIMLAVTNEVRRRFADRRQF